MPSNFVIGTDTIPDTFTFEVTQDINNLDFYAVKKGDLAIESDYMPAPPEAAHPTFTISNETFEIGDTVVYELSVQDFHDIAGFQQALKWDTTMIELIDFHSSYQVFSLPLFNNPPNNGWIPFYIEEYGSGGTSIDDDEVLLSLQFKALTESNPSILPLEFTDSLMQTQVVWLDNQWNLFVVEGNYLYAESEDSTTTSLTQIDLDNQFSIYPNPNQLGQLNVEYYSMKNLSEVSFVIYDISSRIIHREIRTLAKGKNLFSLDLSSLLNGIYYIKVIDERDEDYKMFILER